MDTQLPNASHGSPRREAGLVQRVRASLRRTWSDGTVPSILIACSGGRDSVVLTHLLHGLMRTETIRAGIVHVDHAFRDDSRDSARMVESFGDSLGLNVHIARLDDHVTAAHPGVGAEEALRRERYRAFADVAAETGADGVALAHHQRDQAETVLLHLIRGSGLHGASGMRECSEISVPWWDTAKSARSICLWRPLLSEPDGEIADWHRNHSLPVSEDATNTDRRFRRNAIRQDVLPELESIFPGAVGNLARFAQIAADDEAMLERLATGMIPPDIVHGLRWGALQQADPAMQRRVVRRWILTAGFDGELTFDRITAICELAGRNRSGSRIEIGAGWSVVLAKGVLTLSR